MSELALLTPHAIVLILVGRWHNAFLNTRLAHIFIPRTIPIP